ncbi:MAG: DUF3592 domain-containing protein [Methylophilaceae bacterium]
MKIYFAVVGVLFLILAAWLSFRRCRVLFFGAKSIGTVVGHQVRNSEDSIFQIPIVTYMDAMGKEHQFTSVAGGVAKTPATGARVTVRYLPSDPTIVYISSFLHMWAAPLSLIILGVAGVLSAWHIQSI